MLRPVGEIPGSTGPDGDVPGDQFSELRSSGYGSQTIRAINPTYEPDPCRYPV